MVSSKVQLCYNSVMSISEFENMDINEELEFNNGVGDALKQKESYTFSWKKTAIVLSLGVVVIFLVTFGVLELGKNALNINQESDIELDAITISDAITESSAANWDVLPEDKAPKTVESNNESNVAPIEIKPKVVQAPVIKKVTPKVAAVPVVNQAKKNVVYRVIAGSFANVNNANSELQKIKAKGFDGYVWSLTPNENKVSYKVQVGAFKTSESAQRLVNQLKKKNIQSFISKH